MDLKKFTKNDSCICTSIEGKTIILSLDTDQYFELNLTGSEIWSALDTCETIEELTGHLETRFNTKADISQEVEDFLFECRERGFITSK